MSSVGFIVNPLAGRDIRRLVAHASASSDRAKVDAVRRVALAAVDSGAERLLLAPDRNGLAAAGVAGLDTAAEVAMLDLDPSGHREDTTIAAAALRDEGVAVVVTLGGDGTHRDVALGWRDAPLVPISTGTNNAFPLMVDPTLAGTAAGLVAAHTVEPGEVGSRTKLLTVTLPDGSTLALVDAVLVEGSHTGSRAVWQPESLRAIVAALADPAALGLSAVAGRLHQALPGDDHGVVVHCSPDAPTTVTAPIVPGRSSAIGVESFSEFQLGATTELEGPGVLALDGERQLRLGAGASARITLARDGPLVINPWAAVRIASARGAFAADR